MKKISIFIICVIVGLLLFSNNIFAQLRVPPGPQTITLDVTYNGQDWEDFDALKSTTYDWYHYGLYKRGEQSEGQSRFVLLDGVLNELVNNEVNIEDLAFTIGKVPESYSDCGQVDLNFLEPYSAGLQVSSSTYSFNESHVILTNECPRK